MRLCVDKEHENLIDSSSSPSIVGNEEHTKAEFSLNIHCLGTLTRGADGSTEPMCQTELVIGSSGAELPASAIKA